MGNTGSIVIEQTLHGYSQGHSLLGSSVDLSAEVRRIMLPMSDMSGSRMIRGFEEYITGYPLKEMNSFAIAKTWYAEEMKRPGCVWTHTLLIKFADLPKVINVIGLTELFRRPEGPYDIEGYDMQIILMQDQSSSMQKSFANTFEPSILKDILFKLYNISSNGVFVKSDSTNSFDMLCLLLWQQQWPRIKRNFTFCSGAIESRELNRRALDLQVVPFRLARLSTESMVIDTTYQFLDAKMVFPKWVDFLYNDLFSPSLLRNFLTNFGADVPAELGMFQLLTESYIFLFEEKHSLFGVMDFLAKKFPSRKDASYLKINILEPAINGTRYFLPKYTEIEILFVLSTTKSAESFDYDKLGLNARILKLFYFDQQSTLDLLSRIIADEPNEYGEVALKSVADILGDDGIKDFNWSFTSLVSVLLSLNPKIAYRSEFWQQNVHYQGEIIHFLQRNFEKRDVQWKYIVEILLSNESAINPRVLEQSEPDLAGIILNWLNKDKRDVLAPQWAVYLENSPHAVLEWFESVECPSEFIIQLCVFLLDPNSQDVVKGGIEPWYRLMSESGLIDNEVIRGDVKCFALALAFNLSGEDAILLFRRCFETAYILLSKDQMHPGLWNSIEVHTKPLSRVRNWDKCKRLVRALVDEIILKKYNISSIVSDFDDNEIISAIYRRYEKVRYN